MTNFEKHIVIRGFTSNGTSDFSEKEGPCVLIDDHMELRDALVTLGELQQLIRSRARLTEKRNGQSTATTNKS